MGLAERAQLGQNLGQQEVLHRRNVKQAEKRLRFGGWRPIQR